MKKTLPLIMLLFSAIALQAQKKGEVHVKKSDGSYTYYYSDAGKVSTLTFWDLQHRTGYAVAYNVSGEEVYRSDISRIGGSHLVRFKYHPNGVVKEAHYHWQPDGGIQSGGNYTAFDEQGNKTGFREEEDFWNPGPTKTSPPRKPVTHPSLPPPKPEKDIEELEPGPNLMFIQIKYFYVNLAKHPVNFVPLTKKGGLVEDMTGRQIRVAPGDTVYAGKYHCLDSVLDPMAVLDFEFTTRKKRWAKRLYLESIPGKTTPFDGPERIYFLAIRKR